MTEGKDVAPFFFPLVIDWDVERRSLFFRKKAFLSFLVFLYFLFLANKLFTLVQPTATK